jgi:hypothetical protein
VHADNHSLNLMVLPCLYRVTIGATLLTMGSSPMSIRLLASFLIRESLGLLHGKLTTSPAALKNWSVGWMHALNRPVWNSWIYWQNMEKPGRSEKQWGGVDSPVWVCSIP